MDYKEDGVRARNGAGDRRELVSSEMSIDHQPRRPGAGAPSALCLQLSRWYLKT
jgi:hypothetical protein